MPLFSNISLLFRKKRVNFVRFLEFVRVPPVRMRIRKKRGIACVIA